MALNPNKKVIPYEYQAFPKMLYRAGRSGMENLTVKDEKAMDTALKDGWTIDVRHAASQSPPPAFTPTQHPSGGAVPAAASPASDQVLIQLGEMKHRVDVMEQAQSTLEDRLAAAEAAIDAIRGGNIVQPVEEAPAPKKGR